MSKQINVKEGNYFSFFFFFFCIKSESHLSPVIVLLPWFSTKLPDISAGHVATTGTANSNSKAFTTNAKFQWLLLPNVRGLWQVGKKTFFWRLWQWRKTSKMQNNLLQETETVGLQTKVAEKMIIYTATGDCGSRCPSQNVTMDVRKWMCAGKVKCLLIYQRMR